jgi:hypothetical protein
VLPTPRKRGDVPRVTLARNLLFLAFAAAAPAGAQPRSLGIFSTWGAFRDGARCYAITQPYDAPAPQGWQPFAAVGHWPARGPGGQLHIRLSREKREGSAVLIRIDGRSFQLAGGGRDAWAPDARADVEIQAVMRNGIDLVVETRSTDGRLVRDLYRLRGAATAMDAAAIACAPARPASR